VLATTTGLGRKRRLLLAVAALVLLAAALAAVAGARPDAGAAKKPLRWGVANVGTSPTNPALNNSTNGQILSIAYEPLIYDNPDGSLAPGLALKWGFVKGKGLKVFDLTLRKNARFSDGAPVTAQAVAGWLTYYYNSKNSQSGILGPNPKFKATGKWTVRITLTIPNPALPRLLTQQGVNWSFVASPQAVANPDLFTKATYGAGPYMLDYGNTVPGDHYVYVPNPYYYDKAAIKSSQIYVKVFADSTSALQALKAGQLDAATTTDATTASSAESSGFQVVHAPYAVTFLQLNPHGAKPLADVRVRQAMNYAIDRATIARTLFGKYGSGTSQFFSPSDANPGLENYYKYDPAKAKQLLTAAGYGNGFPLTISHVPGQEKILGLVAHYLDAVGINTKLVPYVTAAAYYDVVFKFKEDAWALAAGTGGVTPTQYGAFIGPGSSFRGGEPVDPQVDRLYYGGLKAKDPIASWKKMWAKIVTDAWFLPTVTADALVYASKSVTGVKMSPRRPTGYVTEWAVT
jgi:peptide/nickel transport system substrate-binding protein